MERANPRQTLCPLLLLRMLLLSLPTQLRILFLLLRSLHLLRLQAALRSPNAPGANESARRVLGEVLQPASTAHLPPQPTSLQALPSHPSHSPQAESNNLPPSPGASWLNAPGEPGSASNELLKLPTRTDGLPRSELKMEASAQQAKQSLQSLLLPTEPPARLPRLFRRRIRGTESVLEQHTFPNNLIVLNSLSALGGRGRGSRGSQLPVHMQLEPLCPTMERAARGTTARRRVPFRLRRLLRNTTFPMRVGLR